LPLSQQEAARELLRRRRARADLRAFANAIEVPGKPISDDPDEWMFAPIETTIAAHHDLMLSALQTTMLTPYGRLMMFLPPGSAKSCYGSVVAPTWYMGRLPGSKIILTSYGSDLAKRHGRRARQIVKQPAYTSVFGAGISSDTSAADEWALDNGSEYLAGGILSGITGNRCFPAGTRLQTRSGSINIEQVSPSTEVLAYDHGSRRPVYRRVLATSSNERSDIVRVSTVAGRQFTCTADHPVYVEGKGYVSAALLEQADALITCDEVVFGMLGARDEGEPRVGEAGSQGAQSVLFSRVHGGGISREVQALRRGSQGAREEERREVLLESMRGRAARATQVCAAPLPSMQCAVSADIVQDGILWPELCGRGALSADDRPWQFEIQGRQELRALVQEHEVSDNRAGQRGVHSVRESRRPTHTSLRRGPGEQRGDESRDALQFVPYDAPQVGADAVSMVERICRGSVRVYDIEVEGTSNFFADSVLVHNCNGLLIDDPVKGREEADSEVIRRKTLDAYQDDLLTRLVPGGWVVIIQTRWHQEDLAGSLLPEDYAGESGVIECRDGQPWTVLCLPAKCERTDDPLGRQIGEYLWPEWFDRRHWAQFERIPRTWSALYQQRPSPEEGSYFRAEWIEYVKAPPAPKSDGWRFYGASDYAVTADGGDWTVHVVVAVDAEDRMTVADFWRGQTTPDVWIDRWCDLVLKWKPIEWAEETGQIRGSVGPFLDKRARERKAWTTRKQFPTRGDKAVRAQSIRGRMAMLGLRVPERAEWVSDFISELTAFPAGRHDDQVDALGLVGQLLDTIQAGAGPKPSGRRFDRYRRSEPSEPASWTTA
jgi:predicted phage terminase large subunit-like protein